MKLKPIINEIKQNRLNEIYSAEEIDIEKSDFHPPNRFSFEVSDKDCEGGLPTVILRNPKTGNKILFRLYKTDKDGSGEDTYGWHYKSADGKYELLIIND